MSLAPQTRMFRCLLKLGPNLWDRSPSNSQLVGQHQRPAADSQVVSQERPRAVAGGSFESWGWTPSSRRCTSSPARPGRPLPRQTGGFKYVYSNIQDNTVAWYSQSNTRELFRNVQLIEFLQIRRGIFTSNQRSREDRSGAWRADQEKPGSGFENRIFLFCNEAKRLTVRFHRRAPMMWQLRIFSMPPSSLRRRRKCTAMPRERFYVPKIDMSGVLCLIWVPMIVVLFVIEGGFSHQAHLSPRERGWYEREQACNWGQKQNHSFGICLWETTQKYEFSSGEQLAPCLPQGWRADHPEEQAWARYLHQRRGHRWVFEAIKYFDFSSDELENHLKEARYVLAESERKFEDISRK